MVPIRFSSWLDISSYQMIIVNGKAGHTEQFSAFIFDLKSIQLLLLLSICFSNWRFAINSFKQISTSTSIYFYFYACFYISFYSYLILLLLAMLTLIHSLFSFSFTLFLESEHVRRSNRIKTLLRRKSYKPNYNIRTGSYREKPRLKRLPFNC